jgi:HEAT repeat protein
MAGMNSALHTLGRLRSAACFAALLLFAQAVVAPAHAQSGNPEASAREALDTMIQAIREQNNPMRDRMFFQLRILGKPSVQPLIGALSHDDPRVREYAAFTLSFLDDDAAVGPLLGLFASDPEVSVRTQAARALGRMEEPRAIDPLIQALNDQRSEIRQDAAYSLGLIGDPRAIPALKAKATDPDELVRFFVDDALVRIDRAVKRKAAEKK